MRFGVFSTCVRDLLPSAKTAGALCSLGRPSFFLLLIWELVDGFVLQQDIQAYCRWKLTQSGSCSSKSAYAAFFVDTHQVCPLKEDLEMLGFFVLQIFHLAAINNRCWTADCLAK